MTETATARALNGRFMESLEILRRIVQNSCGDSGGEGWSNLAQRAGLTSTAVRRFASRETNVPNKATIFALAEAVEVSHGVMAGLTLPYRRHLTLRDIGF